jgi:hypothetical protein
MWKIALLFSLWIACSSAINSLTFYNSTGCSGTNSTLFVSNSSCTTQYNSSQPLPLSLTFNCSSPGFFQLEVFSDSQCGLSNHSGSSLTCQTLTFSLFGVALTYDAQVVCDLPGSSSSSASGSSSSSAWSSVNSTAASSSSSSSSWSSAITSTAASSSSMVSSTGPASYVPGSDFSAVVWFSACGSSGSQIFNASLNNSECLPLAAVQFPSIIPASILQALSATSISAVCTNNGANYVAQVYLNPNCAAPVNLTINGAAKSCDTITFPGFPVSALLQMFCSTTGKSTTSAAFCVVPQLTFVGVLLALALTLIK